MKVAVVSTFPPIHDGVAEYAWEFVKSLAQRDEGVDLVTVTFKGCRGYPYPELRGHGLSVQDVLDRRMWGSGVASYLVRHIHPNIVHVQSTAFLYPRKFSIFPRYLPREIGVIVTAHDVPGYRQFHVFPTLHSVYTRANLIITLSKHVARDLIRFHHIKTEKILTLHHGVDVFRFHPTVSASEFYNRYGISDDKFNIMFFGFLGRSKGINYLLSAFGELKRSVSSGARLILAGSPRQNESYLSELKSTIRRLGLETDVFMTGYVNNELIPSTLAAADVLVYPYLTASQSGPLHFSLAMGKPIIVSDAPGFPEVISDGVNGLVTRAGSVRSLATALGRVYNNGNERARLARNARIYAESHLDWDTISNQIVQIYTEVFRRTTAS